MLKKSYNSLPRKLLSFLPSEGRALKIRYHQLRYYKNRALNILNSRVTDEDAAPDNIFWIDPLRIGRHTNLRRENSLDWEDWVFDQRRSVKPVQGGDWDTDCQKVSDMRIYRALQDRISHSVAWDTTDFYKTALAQIISGRHLWRCSSAGDLDRRCHYIDLLVESISSKGYIINSNIAIGDEDMTIKRYRDAGNEILINIDRMGRCLFQDGRHRLAIAQILGLKEVAVQILVRHEEWTKFRTYLKDMAQSDRGASRKGVLYQSPSHFDLLHIPAEHGCENRFEAIKQHLPINGGNALDIGTNLGYFCRRLETIGFRATGVEYSPDISYAAQRIRLAEESSCNIINGDILDRKIHGRFIHESFDVVFALNIFHHFLKKESDFIRLKEFLQNLRAKMIFFEPHLQFEPHMQQAFMNPGEEEFVKLVRTMAHLECSELICRDGDGRAIYRLF